MKENVEGESSGRLSGKAQQIRVRLLGRFKLVPSPLIRVSRDLVIFLFWYGEREREPLLMEISLTNINVSYKKG